MNSVSYGPEEVIEALESLISTWVTMGKKVSTFEDSFANYLGSKGSVMINSGSTANLIALSILASPTIKNIIMPGEEVIVPAATWSTIHFPVLDIGAIPYL